MASPSRRSHALPAALAAALLAVPAASAAAAGPPAEAAAAGEGGGAPFKVTSSFKLVQIVAHAQPGDQDFRHAGDDTRETDQAALRVQVTGAPAPGIRYELHYLNIVLDTAQMGLSPEPAGDALGAGRYREQSLRGYLERPTTDPRHPITTQTTWWYHELDRASVSLTRGAWRATLGRQPITWGAGRFWQPTDLFLAFSPTEIEREFKPGVDAALVEAFPSSFSSVALAAVAHPRDRPELGESVVAHGRSKLGEVSEGSLVGGDVQGERVVGGSLETSWLGAGWRVEGILFRPRHGANETAGTALYASAGMDRQFASGVTLFAEVYHHSLGATREAELPQVAARTIAREGRLPHLSRNVAAVALDKELTGLLRGTYSAFAAPLQDAAGGWVTSTLQQATLTYSIGDNADAVFSLLLGRGKGLSTTGRPRSEFGHLPDTLFARLQFFF